jgi:type IV pilus assembly protein PilX
MTVYPVAQRGVVLVMTLVFLVLFALLGMAAMQSAGLEARLAGQQRETLRALAAAETGLRDCEAQVAAFNMALPGMVSLSERIASEAVWVTVNWADDAAVRVVSPAVTGVTAAPRCLVEQVDATHFRVTARAVGDSTITVVRTQSFVNASGARLAWTQLLD